MQNVAQPETGKGNGKATVRVDEQLHQELKVRAAMERRTLEELANAAFRQYLSQSAAA